jgi:hypothetical protein
MHGVLDQLGERYRRAEGSCVRASKYLGKVWKASHEQRCNFSQMIILIGGYVSRRET